KSSAGSLLEVTANLEVADATLADALDALRSSANVSLAYSPSLLPRQVRVSCECRNATVGEALDRILDGTGLRFATEREQILIEPVPAPIELARPEPVAVSLASMRPVWPASFSAAVPAVVGTITGQVTDAATGRPLAGAQVVVVGTQRGANTGADG